MPLSEQTRMRPPLAAIVIVAIGVGLAILVYGRGFLLPLAFALLTFTLLDAAVDRIAGVGFGPIRLPRWLATFIAFGIIGAAFMFVANVLTAQVGQMGEAWPRYNERLRELMQMAEDFAGPALTKEISEAVHSINVTSYISGLAGSAGSVLVSLILVVLYVGFLFVERSHMPSKVRALFPHQAQDEQVRLVLASIGESIRRYISIKTLTSMLTGLSSYFILKALKVDFAETWGLVIFMLNYIPNIGSILGVAFPALLALLQFDTLYPFLIIAVGLTAIQFFVGNVLEPYLMGNTLNLSSFVIILSLTFWGTIWGLMGAFLSVPIMVMALIFCAHVPGLRKVAVLLSKDGDLSSVDQTDNEDQAPKAA